MIIEKWHILVIRRAPHKNSINNLYHYNKIVYGINIEN